MTPVEKLLGELAETPPEGLLKRSVRHTDGTIGERPGTYINPNPKQDEDVHALFGNSPTACALKKEQPRHRVVLWLKLKCHTNVEIAELTGYTRETVGMICKQPWFMDAFCRLSSEVGKDAVETMLAGEVVPSIQCLVKLRDSAESDAVKRQAAVDILDRVRGKPVQRVETKSSGTMDINVYDAAALMEEQKRNAEVLRGRGIGIN